MMLIRFVFSAGLLSTLTLGAEMVSAQDSPAAPAGPCLGLDSPQLNLLLSKTQWTVSSDRGAAARSRARLFEGKRMSPEAVTPVLDEEVCAKVVRILKAHLVPVDWTADEAAVVRVDGRYVASFRLRAAGYPDTVGNTYYFDRGFTRIIKQTSS